MRYMLILVCFVSFLISCDVKQVKYEGIPLGVPLEGVKYEPLIDPITGEPFYIHFSQTKYAEGHEIRYQGKPTWIKWDYNTDSTERVMRIEDFYVPYLKDILKKRFEKIEIRKNGKVNDSLYLELKPLKDVFKLPKYDLHLQPEMKEEFMKIAKKNFLKRRPYRIKEDENGREMLITGAVDPFFYVRTPEGKDSLVQLYYIDTFYLDDIEKYGKIGEPILVHRLKGEPWDAVDVPLLFKNKVVAVAHFWAYGAVSWVPRDNLEWDKYPFVDLEEGRNLIQEEIAKRYEKEKILPFIQEIAYFEGGFSLFLCDEKKAIARWASPNTSGGTARVCFVAALLSNGKILFINPMTKEVR